MLQSLHHSQTLPCMSWSPNEFGCLLPTGCIRPSELPLNHPTRDRSASRSPEQNVVVVPARHAYSHCTSVGRWHPSQRAKRYASCQDRPVTGISSTSSCASSFSAAGGTDAKARYCRSVTGVLLISKDSTTCSEGLMSHGEASAG